MTFKPPNSDDFQNAADTKPGKALRCDLGDEFSRAVGIAIQGESELCGHVRSNV